MNEFGRALSAEALKLRRTLALGLAVAAPLAVILLNTLIYSQGRVGGGAQNPLIGFAQVNFTLWSILVLPLYIGLAAGLVAAIEHQSNGWAGLFSLPVNRRTAFAAKWLTMAGIVFLSSAILAVGICGAAALLRLEVVFRSSPVPVGLVLLRALQTFCASGLVISIQSWVSFRWRSFIAGPSVAIAGVFVLLGGVARSGLGTIAVYLYPWALAPTAMGRMWEHHADRWLVTMWGAGSGVLVALAACWTFARRDFY